MMRMKEGQTQMQYGQEADDMGYEGSHGMEYNPAASWGYGWNPYSGNTEYTSGPKYNYRVENKGMVVSKFAHKCEKLKDCESIPGFLDTLRKSFALSDIRSQREKI